MEDLKYCKSDLIDEVAEATKVSKKDAKKIVDKTFELIADKLEIGATVTIQGFARFYSKPAKARKFRKIHTGEEILVGERELPKVKFAKDLINRVKS